MVGGDPKIEEMNSQAGGIRPLSDRVGEFLKISYQNRSQAFLQVAENIARISQISQGFDIF